MGKGGEETYNLQLHGLAVEFDGSDFLRCLVSACSYHTFHAISSAITAATAASPQPIASLSHANQAAAATAATSTSATKKPGNARVATHKINTNSRDVALRVRVIGESEQQARLADARVSDQEQLEEVVVSIFFSTSQHHITSHIALHLCVWKLGTSEGAEASSARCLGGERGAMGSAGTLRYVSDGLFVVCE
jgi:hypothetical protein